MVTRHSIRIVVALGALVLSTASSTRPQESVQTCEELVAEGDFAHECRPNGRLLLPEANCKLPPSPTLNRYSVVFQDPETGCYDAGDEYQNVTLEDALTCADQDAKYCHGCARAESARSLEVHVCSSNTTGIEEDIRSTNPQDAERCFRSRHPSEGRDDVTCF